MATASLDMPPSNRGAPGSKLPIPATLPEPTPTPTEPIDPYDVALAWVDSFNALLDGREKAAREVFLEESYWRDFLCSTWDFHTFHGLPKISAALESGDEQRRLKKLTLDSNDGARKPTVASIDFHGDIKCVQAYLTVDTDVGRGRGLVKIVRDTKDEAIWKAFILFTTLEELKGYEESVYTRRPTGVDHGAHPGRLNWQQRRDAEANCEAPFEPAVLIVGAGQAGLAVAARLKQLGIRALIIDRNDRIGDNWRNRYHQLVLHDSVCRTMLISQVFTPKDKLAEWFETYAKVLELNVWTRTNLAASSWDNTKRHWTVTLQRQLDNKSQETRTFHPHHIVLATGHSGEPHIPTHIPGLASFKGDRLVHSSQFTGPSLHGKGKKAVIVGSCNSAHDIAQDYHEHGYDVTMVQRSSTLVVTSDALLEVDMKGLYSEDGPPTPDADILNHSTPTPVLLATKPPSHTAISALASPLLTSLLSAGFALDSGPHSAGIWLKYLHRGGGYYIDVGCSALIASGEIRVKHDAVERFTERGLVCADGEEILADEVVLATGYSSMRETAGRVVGEEVLRVKRTMGKEEEVGEVWGFDAEGEVRGVWRRSGHAGFWFAGGNLALCRFFSRLLALQILGCEVGVVG
ncbi:MAG: hypothetical protein Q9219_003176 [cf. Caloplaca sp. 3 TL-2023]